MSEGFQGVLNWSPMMLRDPSLSDSYASESDCCYLSSLDKQGGLITFHLVIRGHEQIPAEIDGW